MDKIFTLLGGLLGGLLGVLFVVLVVAVWASPFAVDYYILYVSDLSWFLKIPALCLTTVCQFVLYLGIGTLLGGEEE